MKYVKPFEATWSYPKGSEGERLSKPSPTPEIDDYVACDEHFYVDKSEIRQLKNFTSNNVGKVIKRQDGLDRNFLVEYDVPVDLQSFFSDKKCRSMMKKEIIFWSKNKEDAQDYLEAKKYNL